MPRLSQWMIRSSLLWLLLGSTVGGLLLMNKAVPFSTWSACDPQTCTGWAALLRWLAGWLWAWRSSHVHTMLVGWMLQLAYGVAFWILPRLDARGSRGNEALAWGCYWALNLGALLAVLEPPLQSWLPGWLAATLLVLGGGLYIVANAAFVAHAWPRVVAFRLHPRPERASAKAE